MEALVSGSRCAVLSRQNNKGRSVAEKTPEGILLGLYAGVVIESQNYLRLFRLLLALALALARQNNDMRKTQQKTKTQQRMSFLENH